VAPPVLREFMRIPRGGSVCRLTSTLAGGKLTSRRQRALPPTPTSWQGTRVERLSLQQQQAMYLAELSDDAPLVALAAGPASAAAAPAQPRRQDPQWASRYSPQQWMHTAVVHTRKRGFKKQFVCFRKVVLPNGATTWVKGGDAAGGRALEAPQERRHPQRHQYSAPGPAPRAGPVAPVALLDAGEMPLYSAGSGFPRDAGKGRAGGRALHVLLPRGACSAAQGGGCPAVREARLPGGSPDAVAAACTSPTAFPSFPPCRAHAAGSYSQPNRCWRDPAQRGPG